MPSLLYLYSTYIQILEEQLPEGTNSFFKKTFLYLSLSKIVKTLTHCFELRINLDNICLKKAQMGLRKLVYLKVSQNDCELFNIKSVV